MESILYIFKDAPFNMSPHALGPSFQDSTCDSDLFRKYGISDNGFLPAEAPLQFLPDEYYLPWELLIHNLPHLLKADQLRTEIDSLDVLQTDYLCSEPEWRRAYVILAFLAQGYVWGGPKAAEVGLKVTRQRANANSCRSFLHASQFPSWRSHENSSCLPSSRMRPAIYGTSPAHRVTSQILRR